jgi:hypothetical protein
VNCRPRTLLPNSSEETFLLPDGFFTKLDPQVRLLTLPNFGVNNDPVANTKIQAWYKFHNNQNYPLRIKPIVGTSLSHVWPPTAVHSPSASLVVNFWSCRSLLQFLNFF